MNVSELNDGHMNFRQEFTYMCKAASIRRCSGDLLIIIVPIALSFSIVTLSIAFKIYITP